MFFAVLIFCCLLQASVVVAEGKKEHHRVAVDAGSLCNIGVFLNNNQIATLDAKLLTECPAVEFKAADTEKVQRGPMIKDILQKIGVKEFQQITFYGYAKKRIATAEYTITSKKLNDKVIFSFSKRGTVKLIAPELSFDDWIVDVNKMEIK